MDLVFFTSPKKRTDIKTNLGGIMKKILLFLLILMGIGAVSAEYSYWIEDIGDGQYNIWTKINISAGETKTIYIVKQDGYSPDGSQVFEFFDNFEGQEFSEGQTITNLGTDLFGKIISVKASYGNSNDGQFYISLDGSKVVPIYLSTNGTNNVQTYDGSYHTIATNPTYPVEVEITPYDTTSCKRTVIGYESESYTGGYYSSTAAAGDLKVGSSSGYTWTVKMYEVYVRKYADQEPTVSIEQISDDTYKITISNPNDYDLVDFQIPIEGISLTSDSLLLTDTISDEKLSFRVVSTELMPHSPIILNITNISGAPQQFIINWGDGTTEINADTTTANHTYDWEDNFRITVSSLDSEENIIATNSTTVNVVYNLSEIPYKYLIKVANPTENFTNYPLRLSLNSQNFDFLISKPLGTDIYFRDTEGNIYKHFIQNYSISDQKATVVVQIPQLLPNSYAEFYLCVDRDDKDRAQYTFDTSGTDISILYTIISELSILPDEPNNITTYQMISSTTSSYQNITIVCIDEASYLQKETTGSVRFVSSDGKETFYQLDNFKKGILKVPSSNNTGLIILLTDDGVMRKIPYSTDALNSVFLPPQSAPVLLKGSDGTGWTVYNDRGAYISYVSDDSVVYLTPGQMYDFYVGDEAVKKGYMILGSGDVVYYRKDTPEVMGKIITEQIIMENNNSVKLIISAKQNATIQFSDGANDTLINGNTYTYIKPDGTEYWIYGTDGTEYKHGILSVENWGKLKEFGENYPNLAKWIGYMLIITVLLAGSYITIYIALPASVITALILIRVGWIELDLLTTSLITLIALGSFIYFFVKRNW